MYLKVESYGYKPYGEIVALIMLKINPFTMKLKAEVKLENGESFVLESHGESNDKFQEIVHNEINNKMFFTKSNPPKLHTDGLYVWNFNGSNPRGEHEEFSVFLIFYANKTVVQIEQDGNIYLNSKQVYDALHEDVSEFFNPLDYYTIESDNISIRFFSRKKEDKLFCDLEYKEFCGKIYPKGLILDAYISYYNVPQQDFIRKLVMEKINFKLIT